MADEYEDAGVDDGVDAIGDDDMVNSEEDNDDALEDEKDGSDDNSSEEEVDEDGDERADGTDCAYRHMRAKKSLKDEPIETEEYNDDTIINATMGGYHIIEDPNMRVTRPIATIYEFQRVLGLRSIQLAAGAQSLVQSKDQTLDSFAIASLEMRLGLSPYIILRPMPGYKIPTAEKWFFRDLRIPDNYWQEKPAPLPKGFLKAKILAEESDKKNTKKQTKKN
jgi:DNA-directed RNA polymerase subunit K/omega